MAQPAISQAPQCLDEGGDLPNAIAFDQFMGINLRRADPIEFAQCVTNVREYHNWDIDEVNGSVYPDNIYEFHPANAGQSVITSFDNFYQTLQGQGNNVCSTIIHSSEGVSSGIPNSDEPPSYVVQNWDYCADPLNVLPDEPLSPLSYEWRGDYITQYVNRYGGNPTMPLTVEQDKNSDAASPANGGSRGLVQFVENWNEQDAWWNDFAAYIEPEVYAAFSSVDYDGFVGLDAQGQPIILTGQNGCTGTEYPIGLANLGSDIGFVMGGLSDLDECYFEDVINWFQTNRTGHDPVFPFDVINFHHYSAGAFHSTGPGISPEADGLFDQLKRLDLIRDGMFPNRELWLSEFGYSTLEGPDAVANQYLAPILTHPDNPEDADRYEVQGQWIVRSFLAIAAADFDRAYVYEIRDATNNPIGAWDFKCGLLESMYDGFQPKKSWYYTYSLKNILAGMDFDEIIDEGSLGCDDRRPRIYRFTGGAQDIFAIWSPTSCNVPEYEFEFPAGGLSAAYYYRLEVPSTTGIKVDVAAGTNGMVTVPVSERPIFLVLDKSAFEDVACPENLMVENITCSSVNLYWDIPPGMDYDHYQFWYGPVNGIADPANPDIFLDDITLFEHDLDGDATQAFIGNLEALTEYIFYVVPHEGNNSASWCGQILATTTNEGCHIEMDYETMVTLENEDGSPFTAFSFAPNLFDDQTDFPDIGCCFLPEGTEHTYTDWISNGETVVIDLGEPYDIDVVYLYDGQGVGSITVEYETALGVWEPYVNEYVTSLYLRWVTFANDTPPCAPIQRLRVRGAMVGDQVGELILCGKPMSIYDINGNFTYTEDCATFSFTSHPDDAEFNHSWAFGDLASGSNNFSEEPNPVHIFSGSSTYTVVHTVTNLCNEVVTEAQVEVSVVLPDPAFTIDLVPCEVNVAFTSSGEPDDEHLWEFDPPVVGPFTGASPTVTFPEPGSGGDTYTVTHTISNNCGTASQAQAVTIEDCSTLNCDCPTNSIEVGAPGSVTSFSDFVPGQPTGATNVIIQGTVEINTADYPDNQFSFSGGSNVCMGPEAELVLVGSSRVSFQSAHIRGCGQMWKRISVGFGGQLVMGKLTLVEDGQYAVEASAGASLLISSTIFDKNYVGIHVPQPANPNMPQIFGVVDIRTNQFLSTSALLPPYSGQSPVPTGVSHAGLLLHNSLGINVGVDGSPNSMNEFVGLENGIIAKRTNMGIFNASFSDIIIDDDYGELDDTDNCAIYSSDAFNFSVKDCIFDNCRAGIRAQRSDLTEISGNQMQNVGFGVSADLVQAKSVSIINNPSLNCHFFGIAVNNSIGMNSLDISENILNMSYPGMGGMSNMSGIFVGNSTFDSDASISKNEVEWDDSYPFFGILALQAPNLNIINNNPISFFEGGAGIFLGSSDGATVLDNFIECTNGTNDWAASIGIAVSNSRDWDIGCNTILDVSFIGSLFIGDCTGGTDFHGNSITYSGSTDVYSGLYLHQAIIGPQPFSQDLEKRGNQWHGIPNANPGLVRGALYYGDAQFISASRFFVHTDEAPYHPKLIEVNGSSSNTGGWFEAVFDNNFFQCPPMFAPPTGDDCTIRKAVADGDISAAGYGDGTQWTASRKLYRELLLEPETGQGCIEGFLEENASSAIGEFHEVDAEIASIFQLNGGQLSELEGLLSGIRTLMGKIAEIDKELDVLSSDFPEMAEERAAQVAQLSQLMNQVYALWAGRMEEQKTMAVESAAANAAVNVDKTCEENRKVVNWAVLGGLAYNQGESVEDFEGKIYSIAEQCPSEGGDAVYQARAMLTGKKNWQALDCEGQYHKKVDGRSNAILGEDSVTSRIKVYPNPHSGDFQIDLSSVLPAENVEFYIFDVNGRSIFHGTLVSGENHRVHTESLSAGLYFFRLFSEHGKEIQSGRMVVQ